MYGGSGVSPGRLAVQPQPPASFAEVLEQLDRAVAAPGSQPPRRPREAFPEPVVVEPLEQQHLAPRPLDRNPRRHDARVVDDRRARRRSRPAALRTCARAPAGTRVRRRSSRDSSRRATGCCAIELRREVVLELPRFHPAPTVPLSDMDDTRRRARTGAGRAAAPRAPRSIALLTRGPRAGRARSRPPPLRPRGRRCPGRVGDAVRDRGTARGDATSPRSAGS